MMNKADIFLVVQNFKYCEKNIKFSKYLKYNLVSALIRVVQISLISESPHGDLKHELSCQGREWQA